jgi:hypothetical protein
MAQAQMLVIVEGILTRYRQAQIQQSEELQRRRRPSRGVAASPQQAHPKAKPEQQTALLDNNRTANWVRRQRDSSRRRSRGRKTRAR